MTSSYRFNKTTREQTEWHTSWLHVFFDHFASVYSVIISYVSVNGNLVSVNSYPRGMEDQWLSLTPGWLVRRRDITWWRHQMETFSALLALCSGNSPVTGEFLTQRPVTRSFDVFLDQRLNKRLSKQSWGWWFETPSRTLWRHCNDDGFLSRRIRNTQLCCFLCRQPEFLTNNRVTGDWGRYDTYVTSPDVPYTHVLLHVIGYHSASRWPLLCHHTNGYIAQQ